MKRNMTKQRNPQNSPNDTDLSIKNMMTVLLLTLVPFVLPAIIILYVGLFYFDISDGALILIEISWVIVYIVFFKVFKKRIVSMFDKFF